MADLTRMASKLGALTLEEKASLCSGSDFWHTAGVGRLDIPAVRVSDGPHGIRRPPDGGEQVGVGDSVPATCFPTASALGSSFNPDLAYRVGQALAVEARAQGVAVVLGPGVNIKRSPLCGRNFEYLSEDPLVSGILGAALVRGLQSSGVGASVKHYAANNQETDRLRVSADVDERTLREIYLAAFERVVAEANPWTVMCSYNKVNGVYASEHHWLLTQVLRNEWGYEGLVVSDWGAVHDRAPALAAGLDLEMPPHLGVSPEAIVTAVQAGELDEAVLDRSVARVLALVDKSLVDKSPVGTASSTGARPTGSVGSQSPGAFDVDAHNQLAREAAGECAVLLKNDRGALPLQLGSGETLAVIGGFARQPRFQGGGSSQVNPTRTDVPLDELRACLPESVDVRFAAGYGIGATDQDIELAAEALALAKQAKTVVMFLGLPEADESEGYDREHIFLPPNQVSLIEAVAAVNPSTVVVLTNGSVVQLSSWEGQVAAVLECWLSGQATGGAVADLLTGAVNPSGRLAETIPLKLEDSPSYLNFPGEYGYTRYGEGVFVGYRGFDKLGRDVSYPFGHGLSYTTFAYEDLDVTLTGSHAAGDLGLTVTCRVTNSGRRQGKEVVQLYVGDVVSTMPRPRRELKGFAKVDLEPGQQETVTFTLVGRDLSYWSTLVNGWALEPGEFELAVGASSRDLRLSTVVYVDAPPVRPHLTHMSSLDEWLADPDGHAVLEDLASKPDGAMLKALMANQEFAKMVGNFPISSLAVFAGLVVDAATVERLLGTASAQVERA